MTRAIYRTQNWLKATPANEVANTIAEYFAHVPIARLTASIRAYQKLGVWGKDPRLPRTGYERLKASIISAGAIKHDVAFEDAVDNSLAEEAMIASPPA
jgi:hypothetical protein